MRHNLFPWVATFAILVAGWGCGRQVGTGDQVRSLQATNAHLETANAKLQHEAKLSIELRDELKAQIARVEAEQGTLRAALAESTARRDALANDVKARTAERDEYAGQFDLFRKSLRDSLAKADASLAGSPVLHTRVQATPVSNRAGRE